MLAEGRADAADHARLVRVAEHREVVGERHVEALPPGADQVRDVARADAGPGDLDAAEADADQLGEVLRRRLLDLGELDPAILGHRRRVDEVHRLLRVPGEDPDQDRDPEQARVVLGDPAVEVDLDPVDGPVAEALARGGRAARRGARTAPAPPWPRGAPRRC